MRDENTYTGDGEDLDLVTLGTEGRRDRGTEGQLQKTSEGINSSNTAHHRGEKKSAELKPNWLWSKHSRYRSKHSWAEIPSGIRRHKGALYVRFWGGSLHITLPINTQ